LKPGTAEELNLGYGGKDDYARRFNTTEFL